MKVLDIITVNSPAALVGQKTVPNVYANKKFKPSTKLPKKRKNVYGTPLALGGGNVGNSSGQDECSAGSAGGSGGDAGGAGGGP